MRLARILLLSVSCHALAVAADEFVELRAAVARGDYAQALPALSAAGERGDVRALTLLAGLYQEGRGVTRDATKARELYTRAAELGDAEAQFNLGNIYLLGEGIEADEAWALTYYRQAAAQGHELAQRNLAELYKASGITPPPPDSAPPAAPTPTERAQVEKEPVVTPTPAVAATALAPTSTPATNPPVAGSVTPLLVAPAKTPAPTAAPVAPSPDAAAQRNAVAVSADEMKALELARSRGVAITSEPAAGSGSSRTAPRAAPARERMPDAERAAAMNGMTTNAGRVPLAAPADPIPPRTRAPSPESATMLAPTEN